MTIGRNHAYQLIEMLEDYMELLKKDQIALREAISDFEFNAIDAEGREAWEEAAFQYKKMLARRDIFDAVKQKEDDARNICWMLTNGIQEEEMK